jgi:hypothetical protein
MLTWATFPTLNGTLTGVTALALQKKLLAFSTA